VEGAFASGQALHDQSGFLIHQDCHKNDSSDPLLTCVAHMSPYANTKVPRFARDDNV
jgi:hypothetical protein